jgi:head-tail adaptor
MPAIGQLRHRIAFDARPKIDDGAGNTDGDFEEQFIVSAAVQAKFGGESVTASRLSGRQPFTITVRRSSLTRRITTDWRARDVRSSADIEQQTVYNIQSIADLDDQREWLELLCETGVAT